MSKPIVPSPPAPVKPARSLDKSIVRDRETGDFAMYLDGMLVGYARTRYKAEDTLDELVYALLTHDLTPIDPAAVVGDAATWGAVSEVTK